MIVKSLVFESNLEKINNNICLFYGENLGLKNDFKIRITKQNTKHRVFKYDQDEILNNQDKFFEEVNNPSLFEDKKLFFINKVNDKFLKILDEILNLKYEKQIYLFADLLEKKSKLRNLFEKEKKLTVVPCYKDDDVSIKKIISNSLKDYSGLTAQAINTIHKITSNDRIKLKNEITKIETFFENKTIKLEQLEKLLNLKEENDFNLLRDACISGERLKSNELLNNDILEKDKLTLYIASINQRLYKLQKVMGGNLDNAINALKPPLFWKDKPIFLNQAKLWNSQRLKLALTKAYDTEIKIKSNNHLNKEIIVKKFLIDICNLANAA